MKTTLQAEDSYKLESKKLDEMFNQNQIDAVSYPRMKKALQVIYNEKLMKIHNSYQN